MIYKNEKEGFNNTADDNFKNNILLGDSIFKNNLYVSQGNAVEDILKNKNAGNIYCYAENNSKIYNVYNQLNNIPLELNNPNSTIFLSIGGNDILDRYVERSNPDLNDTDYLNTIFGAYKKLVKSIKIKMEQCNLVLSDVYYPSSSKYLPYREIITMWNNKVNNYAKEHNIMVLKISSVLTQPDDFALEIEPSEKGGNKLADFIHKFN